LNDGWKENEKTKNKKEEMSRKKVGFKAVLKQAMERVSGFMQLQAWLTEMVD
jgi:hypothetical protein